MWSMWSMWSVSPQAEAASALDAALHIRQSALARRGLTPTFTATPNQQ